MDNEQEKVAYIIGNAYGATTQLSGVYTVNQFFSAMFEKNLPNHRLWIVGQGIHESVHEILNVCKKFRSDIYFHGDEETRIIEKTQSTFLSKLLQRVKFIIHRLVFFDCRRQYERQ